jgi:hypothetical protein
MRLTRWLATALLAITACSSDVTITGGLAVPFDCDTVDVSTQDDTGLYDHKTVGCGFFSNNGFSITSPSNATGVRLVLQAHSTEHDDADDDVGVVLQLRPLTGDASVGTVDLTGP